MKFKRFIAILLIIAMFGVMWVIHEGVSGTNSMKEIYYSLKDKENLVDKEEVQKKEISPTFNNEVEAKPLYLLSDEDIGQLNSKAVCVMEDETGKIIYEKNGTEHLAPASLTKMMTALISAENTERLDVPVYLSQEMTDYLLKENAGVAGFAPGMSFPFEDVVYGLLLPSGGDAALMLANKDGSEEEFIQKMNNRAKELGMNDTNFKSVTGLDKEGQYSSARDMALLLRYCMDNPFLSEVMTTENYQTGEVPGYPNGIPLKHTVLKNCTNPEKEYIKGGKSGTTEEAGLCWATFCKINNKNYEIVVMGATLDDLHDPTLYQKQDTLKILKALRDKI